MWHKEKAWSEPTVTETHIRVPSKRVAWPDLYRLKYSAHTSPYLGGNASKLAALLGSN